jgi:hypothetical protein
MTTPSSLPAVVTLRSSLRTIDEQLGTGALAPDQVEDVKSAIDDIRFRIWGVLAAKSPSEYRVFRERFRLRRATEICNGLTADIVDGRLVPTHREAEELRAALQSLQEKMQPQAGA